MRSQGTGVRSESQRVKGTFLFDFSLAKERILINVSQDFVSGKVINAILLKPSQLHCMKI